jgi:hypothetical protein
MRHLVEAMHNVAGCSHRHGDRRTVCARESDCGWHHVIDRSVIDGHEPAEIADRLSDRLC